ncbi:MAG: hypothetical protein FH749_06900 [Firmicutes bacterium]|nr:hypothetical protein [Bacillota bacterium]
MKAKKHSWCPIIKDPCKDSYCVCYVELKNVNEEKFGFCRYLGTEVPLDRSEDDATDDQV